MTAYFPISLNLSGRRCVVVGGGDVADRKVAALLAAGADNLRVVAPEVAAGIVARAAGGSVHLTQRRFEPEDLDGAFLVLVATDDSDVNAQAAAAGRARGALVNVADDPAQCDFIMPAVVRRGDLEVAITTGGRSPAFARFVRELLEDVLPAEYEALLDIISDIRAEVRSGGPAIDPELWQVALRSHALDQVRRGDLRAAADAIRAILQGGERPIRNQGRADRSRSGVGSIALVGAGPGDPGLITVAGQRALSEADVVLYDRLANQELLATARTNAQLVYAGKSPRGDGPMTQEEINTFMCAEALEGRHVVRLKGGDPFVFGRGGEEALAAVRAGIPFTVIPGVTAAVAAPAYAGVPVTHRGLSSSFTVVTGQQDPGAPRIDWQALGRLGGTLVLLMGLDPLPRIASEMVAGGLPPDTPAVVVEWGTLPQQRMVAGSVKDIADRAQAAGLSAPVTTVIGQVASLAEQLAWFAPVRRVAR